MKFDKGLQNRTHPQTLSVHTSTRTQRWEFFAVGNDGGWSK